MPPSVARPQVRSRKVDNRRPLPVFRASELQDLDDSSSINRAVELSRGVDHEEESETHLQQALHTAYGQGQVAAVIPTPDASRLFPAFATYYSADYQLPISFIRFSSQVEDVIGVDFNLSVEDDRFLQTYNSTVASNTGIALSEDSLEELLAALEWVAAEKLTGGIPSQEEFETYIDVEKLDLAPLKPAVSSVYGYWKSRRERDGGNKPLIPQLRLDEYGPKADSDPYVCFRKREIKAVRKTRRCDSQSLEKLLKLREEMRKAHRILELVTDRERKKRESLIMEHQIFEQRSLIRRLKKKLGKLSDKSDSLLKKKKSKKEESRIQTRIKIPLPKSNDNGEFDSIADTIDEKVRRRKFAEEIAGIMDFTEDPYIPLRPAQPPTAQWCFEVPVNQAALLPWSNLARIGCKSLRGRHRIGRGGRVIMDRRVFRHKSTVQPPPHHTQGKFVPNARSALDESYEFENECEDILEDEIMEVEDAVPFILYRTVNLVPTQVEMRGLVNKPAFPEQLDPARAPSTSNITTALSRLSAPPKQTDPAAPPKASTVKAPPPKKKANTPVVDDRRTNNVKTILQQAQRQAQQTKQQLLQHGLRKGVLGATDASPPNTSSSPLLGASKPTNGVGASLSTAAQDSSPPSTSPAKATGLPATNGASAATAPSPILAGLQSATASPTMNTLFAQQLKQAQLQRQLQQQQLQQAAQQQKPLSGGQTPIPGTPSVPLLPPGFATLTPQQQQQYFLQQQRLFQQQMLVRQGLTNFAAANGTANLPMQAALHQLQLQQQQQAAVAAASQQDQQQAGASAAAHHLHHLHLGGSTAGSGLPNSAAVAAAAAAAAIRANPGVNGLNFAAMVAAAQQQHQQAAQAQAQLQNGVQDTTTNVSVSANPSDGPAEMAAPATKAVSA